MTPVWSLLLSAVIVILPGCGDKYDTIEPPAAAQAGAKLPRPSVNKKMTRELFSMMSEKEIGDNVGRIEIRDEGILIHPGETKPTTASFNIARTKQGITLILFIATLPDNAKGIKEAGTVGVQFVLDGRYGERFEVNRDSYKIKTLDLSDVDTIDVLVDNKDGKAWFDWLMLAVGN